MAKCHNEGDTKWESHVDGHFEGNFIIEELGGGNFRGIFEGTNVRIHGRCREKPNRPHKIRFVRDDTGHIYTGVFVVGDDRQIEGLKVDPGNNLRASEAALTTSDEDWVAVKVGTLLSK